jgi:hypothetical protein
VTGKIKIKLITAAVTVPPARREKVLVSPLHFPAFKAELYCAEFSVIHFQ